MFFIGLIPFIPSIHIILARVNRGSYIPSDLFILTFRSGLELLGDIEEGGVDVSGDVHVGENVGLEFFDWREWVGHGLILLDLLYYGGRLLALVKVDVFPLRVLEEVGVAVGYKG